MGGKPANTDATTARMANERFIFPPWKACLAPIVGRRRGTAIPNTGYRAYRKPRLSRVCYARVKRNSGGSEMPDAPAAPVTTVALVEDDRATRERLASSVRAQDSLHLVAEYRNGAEAL